LKNPDPLTSRNLNALGADLVVVVVAFIRVEEPILDLALYPAEGVIIELDFTGGLPANSDGLRV